MTTIQPANVYALIVGIEQYQAGSDYNLKGPAQDALRFADWLLGQEGVNPNHLYLFLSPLDPQILSEARSKGLSPLLATHDQIDQTIRSKLISETSRGDVLYVFWSGHGIITKTETTTRRLFFSDTNDDTKWNLNLNSLIDALESARDYQGFTQQVFLIDACANLFYPDLFQTLQGVASEVKFAASGQNPKEQFILFASPEYDVAKNDTNAGTGFFAREVLKWLQPRSLSFNFKDMANDIESSLLAIEQLPSVYWWRRVNGNEEITLDLSRGGRDARNQRLETRRNLLASKYPNPTKSHLNLSILAPDMGKQLREVLIAAFTPKRLAMMVEDELKIELYRITSEEQAYDLVVRDLVKWADQNGKVRDLVLAAHQVNSGNEALNAFFREHWLTLLGAQSSPFSAESLQSLLKILEPLDRFAEIVLPACQQVVPELLIHYPNVQAQLLCNQVSPFAKWVQILELFLKHWVYAAKQQLYLTEFVQAISLRVQGETQSMLNQWLRDLPTELQPAARQSPQAFYPNRPPDELLQSLSAHFLIVVEPPEITDQTGLSRVNGYVLTRLGESDQFSKIHKLDLRDPAEASAQDRIDASQQYKGIFCNLTQIEMGLAEWVIQAQELAESYCLALQQEYQLQSQPIHDLIIEFWLPFEYLTVAADTWKIYRKPILKRQRLSVVGKKYHVVVRSYDRFDDADALNELRRMWQKCLMSLSNDDAELLGVAAKIHSLENWSHLSTLQSLAQQACLGLLLTCPFDRQDYDSYREEVFSWMLDKGIPMALWCRNSSVDGVQQMNTLLSNYKPTQPKALLEQIKHLREQATVEQPLGNHLAIWYDEPEQLSQLKQFLQKPGRLNQ